MTAIRDNDTALGDSHGHGAGWSKATRCARDCHLSTTTNGAADAGRSKATRCARDCHPATTILCCDATLPIGPCSVKIDLFPPPKEPTGTLAGHAALTRSLPRRELTNKVATDERMLTVPEAEYPFRNLVFQGGGMKMFAYHGALQVLEEAGILEGIERVAGASSGSLTAMLVSLRLPVAETIGLFQQFDYSRIPEANGSSIDENPDEGDPGHRAVPSSADAETAPAPASDEGQAGSPEDSRPLWEQLTTGEWAQNFQDVVGNVKAVMRLVNQHGWYANRNLYRWIGDVIADQVGDRRATFRDFQRQGRRDLYVIATNLSHQRAEVFSVDTTPDVAVADALLLSQSIPLFFEAPRFDGRQLGRGDYYTDGGVLDNFPLQLFDEPRHVYARANFVDGINHETLGCRLFTPRDCQEPAEIRTLVDFVVNLFLTMNAAEDIAYASNPTAQQRTVEISNCCVESTDFDLRPHPDDPRYRELVEAGRSAMRRYLADYPR